MHLHTRPEYRDERLIWLRQLKSKFKIQVFYMGWYLQIINLLDTYAAKISSHRDIVDVLFATITSKFQQIKNARSVMQYSHAQSICISLFSL
jgi:hypothetical protein